MRFTTNRPIQPSISTHERAKRAMATHEFIWGLGYINHGTPPIRHGAGVPTSAAAAPPANTKNRTMHVLVHAGGGRQVFRWLAEQQAWEPIGKRGRRMAFLAAYLGKCGWSYVGQTNSCR